MVWILVCSWIICSVVSFGMGFAYFQRAYPIIAKENYSEDILFAIILSIFGPISLLSNIVWIKLFSIHGYQGLKFK